MLKIWKCGRLKSGLGTIFGGIFGRDAQPARKTHKMGMNFTPHAGTSHVEVNQSTKTHRVRRFCMGVIEFFVIAVVIGLAIWAIHRFLPIPAPIKTIILWVGVVVLILLLLAATGILGSDVKIPRFR